jgi:formate dehydrogenase subunit delta
VTGLPSVIRLANDIASQFEHKPHDAAVEAIARHLNAFWDPRMRRELADIAASYRGDLRTIVFDVIPALHLDTPHHDPTVPS